nr:hypothetical protein GCM10020185_21560 [Pseudomonas brassicacearum subsp. brassicacearum]
MIGTCVGALAGYIGGRFDTICMRLIDIILAFPFLVLMLAIMAILGPGLGSFLYCDGFGGLGVLCTADPFADSGTQGKRFRLGGEKAWASVMDAFCFGTCCPMPCSVRSCFSMSDAVLVLLNGAAVSYLGLGGSSHPPPSGARWSPRARVFITNAWWICTFPGLAIVTLAMGFSLLADGVAEHLGERP